MIFLRGRTGQNRILRDGYPSRDVEAVAMVRVPSLGKKIDLIRKAGNIRTQADLASMLGMEPRRLSEAKNQREDREQRSEQLGEEPFQKLVALYRRVARLELTKEEAETLLKSDDFRAFATSIEPSVELLDVLQASKRPLKVEYVVAVWSGLEAVGGVRPVPANAVKMQKRDEIRFFVHARAGKLLTVLCVSDVDVWEVVVPSDYHSGRVIGCPTEVPDRSAPGIYFIPPYATHRFFFIEHDDNFALLEDAWLEKGKLAQEEVQGAALRLAARSNASKWRSAEVVVHVEDPDSVPAQRCGGNAGKTRRRAR